MFVKNSAFQISQLVFLKQGLTLFHWIAFNCHNIFFSLYELTVNCCVHFCIIGCSQPPYVSLCFNGTLLKVLPSSQGCCSLASNSGYQKMYILHLVLMRLIGLIKVMPVNIQLVSEGKNGWFAAVSMPFLENPHGPWLSTRSTFHE